MSEEKKPYRIEGRPQTIYRVVKSANNPYVMIDRRPIDNPAMSWKAKGMLTYLMSRPDGWEVSVSDLINHAKDGEASTRAGLKELKDAGHMKYTKMRDKGRITGWLIEVFEIPHSDFQDVENQDMENRRQVLKNLSSTKRIKKDSATQEKPKKQPKEKPATHTSITLFREVVSRYPAKVNYDDVIASVARLSERLGRDAVKDDLIPFYKRWCSLGYNPYSLSWMEWAENGKYPENGLWKPKAEVGRSTSETLVREL